jgi:hypothetical protein
MSRERVTDGRMESRDAGKMKRRQEYQSSKPVIIRTGFSEHYTESISGRIQGS